MIFFFYCEQLQSTHTHMNNFVAHYYCSMEEMENSINETERVKSGWSGNCFNGLGIQKISFYVFVIVEFI